MTKSPKRACFLSFQLNLYKGAMIQNVLSTVFENSIERFIHILYPRIGLGAQLKGAISDKKFTNNHFPDASKHFTGYSHLNSKHHF